MSSLGRRDGVGVDVHVMPSLADEDVAQVWAAAFDLAAGEAQMFATVPTSRTASARPRSAGTTP